MDFRFSPEEEAFRQRMRAFAREKLEPLAHEADESDVLSPAVVAALKAERLWSHLIPKEFGGAGLKAVNVCIIRESISGYCHHADTVFAMSGLCSYPIIISGTEAQRKRYLPAIASGEMLGSYALTEPDAGSDVAGIKTAAVAQGDGYVINGTKRFISMGGAAHVYVVFAKTDPTKGSRGISAFAVEEGTPGFHTKAKMEVMAPHVIAQLRFTDCRVPKTSLVGSEGEGTKIALRTLDLFRATVGASTLGMGQRAFEEAVKYAKQRQAFGKPIAELQAIQFKLADMATALEAARFLIYHAAWLKDSGKERVTREASMAKLFASEAAYKAAFEALQIHGGSGLIRGSLVERLFRATRAPLVYEGTSEVQRVVIAREILEGS
jgi:alkylation response protein AidB-like acyl-CoA dehydrogenase